MSYIKRFKPGKYYQLEEALRLNCHARPKTRREMIAQGFSLGAASVFGASMMHSNSASAQLSTDITDREGVCGIESADDNRVAFICFDLAGGANIAGSNVLVGGPGGQMDFLSTAGYSKQGLPADMVPGTVAPNTDLGLAFHPDSQMLEGILEKFPAPSNINGAVIAARSENDTGNNPHNPMYAIAASGAKGNLLRLIGSRSSDSGGNSMAPASLIRPEWRPTKIDRPSDTSGLVDAGDFGVLNKEQVASIMESVSKISDQKLDKIIPGFALGDASNADPTSCVYVKTASLVDRYFGIDLSPLTDPDITGAGGIFANDFDDREFQKTASVMKMVIDGEAGAGTVTMGGYDYHTGDRATGEQRDLRAGRCMGACLEYARRKGVPLMMYVFSDGSVFSNGMTDDSQNGRGKGVWTGDNQQTAAAFFLIYNPGSPPQLIDASRQQLGWMRASGDVETVSSPAANNVTSLVGMVTANYLALNGRQADLLGAEYTGVNEAFGPANIDNYIAFQPLSTQST